MPVEGVDNVEEQRALVYEYFHAPYGSKGRWLAERGVSESQMRRWSSMVVADTLGHGLVPRGGSGLRGPDKPVVTRLLAENEALRAQLAAREKDLAIQARAVDALGKAIEILQHDGARRTSSTDRAGKEPTRDLDTPAGRTG